MQLDLLHRHNVPLVPTVALVQVYAHNVLQVILVEMALLHALHVQKEVTILHLVLHRVLHGSIQSSVSQCHYNYYYYATVFLLCIRSTLCLYSPPEMGCPLGAVSPLPLNCAPGSFLQNNLCRACPAGRTSTSSDDCCWNQNGW